MEKNIIKRFISSRVFPLLLFILILLVIGAKSSSALTRTLIRNNLNKPVAIALDEGNNCLYFVGYNTGKLMRIILSPPYTITTVASGFPHPVDVSLDTEDGLAYVLTKDFPVSGVGSGGLYKVYLTTGQKNVITFNLADPKQLALDLNSNRAYTVSSDGKVRSIELDGSNKIPVNTSLTNPRGIVITNDSQAYVTEKNPGSGRVVKIGLNPAPPLVVAGDLNNPFFLKWANTSQTSLYMVERDPVNKVSRIDLSTSNPPIVVISSNDLFGQSPYGIAVNEMGSQVYVSTLNKIYKFDLIDLNEPVFMAVGNVPVTEIYEGYADTTADPNYFYQVKHCPFGGTLDIFGNFDELKTRVPNAMYYAVKITKSGEPSFYFKNTWTVKKWDQIVGMYVPFLMAPIQINYHIYKIPLDGSVYIPSLWQRPYWMMRWPTETLDNGAYTLSIELYDSEENLIPFPLNLVDKNKLILYIDNTPPQAVINEIWQVNNSDPIPTCYVVNDPPNQFYFKITASDVNHHLLSYSLSTQWGNGNSAVIYSDSYSNHISPSHPYPWDGIVNTVVRNPNYWSAPCSCAYTFYLVVSKRTINGYNYILHRSYQKSFTINNTGNLCN